MRADTIFEQDFCRFNIDIYTCCEMWVIIVHFSLQLVKDEIDDVIEPIDRLKAESQRRKSKLLEQVCITNTPGTAGGPGGRNQTLAVKSRKNARKSVFFHKKIKIS